MVSSTFTAVNQVLGECKWLSGRQEGSPRPSRESIAPPRGGAPGEAKLYLLGHIFQDLISFKRLYDMSSHLSTSLYEEEWRLAQVKVRM